jgi:hypothetical protein
LVLPATAFLAALAGGVVSRLLTNATASAYGTIRATRFELVDEAGKATAFIGADSERDTHLYSWITRNMNEPYSVYWGMARMPPRW